MEQALLLVNENMAQQDSDDFETALANELHDYYKLDIAVQGG